MPISIFPRIFLLDIEKEVIDSEITANMGQLLIVSHENYSNYGLDQGYFRKKPLSFIVVPSRGIESYRFCSGCMVFFRFAQKYRQPFRSLSTKVKAP
jgi:hypothetical protein